MREIKLRTWYKNQMIPFLNLSGVNDYFNEDAISLICQMPNEFTVMQYTGLKDKNGKEIYEGDIVHIQDGYEGDTKISSTDLKVVFEDAEFFLCKGKGTFDYMSLFDAINNFGAEVTGNIYENSTAESHN